MVPPPELEDVLEVVETVEVAALDELVVLVVVGTVVVVVEVVEIDALDVLDELMLLVVVAIVDVEAAVLLLLLLLLLELVAFDVLVPAERGWTDVRTCSLNSGYPRAFAVTELTRAGSQFAKDFVLYATYEGRTTKLFTTAALAKASYAVFSSCRLVVEFVSAGAF